MYPLHAAIGKYMQTVTTSVASLSLLSSHIYVFFSQGANESQPQALWRLEEPLQWAPGRLHREPGHVRQKTKGRWMWYSHKTTHPHILVNMSPTESMQMHVAHTKRSGKKGGVGGGEWCLPRLWKLRTCFMHADMLRHWYLPCCIYEPTVSNRLRLIDLWWRSWVQRKRY